MSALYLFRHGQAGPRNRYDELSDLGHRQAQLLGEYLASQAVPFEVAYSGAMRRQRETAAHVKAAYERAGLAFPEVIADPRWNEFNLGHVYDRIGPQLACEDEEFRADYEEMMATYTDPAAPFHRNSTRCDAKVVRAWVSARYDYDGESWEAFRSRVTEALESLKAHADQGEVAVFTSATPTAISVASVLELTNGRAPRLAGVTYNSSITTLRIQKEDFTLFSFNGIPHLPDPATRSFR